MNESRFSLPFSYEGNYSVSLRPYKGEDYSKSAFLFPGQGVALEGQYEKEIESISIFNDYFKLADKLSQKYINSRVSDFSFAPDKIESHKKSSVANLWQFTMCVSMAKEMKKLNIYPEVVTGHSFGEFCALVISEILDFSEVFEFLYYREKYSPAPFNSGRLIALYISPNEAQKKLINYDVDFCNFNSPDQVVIGVELDRLNTVLKILRSKKIEYVELKRVPQAYHSRLMLRTQYKLKEFLEKRKYEFSAPKISIYSSSLNKFIDQDNFKSVDINQLLSSQVVNPVYFDHQMDFIYRELGVRNFIEVTPKVILKDFVDRILVDQNKFVTDSNSVLGIKSEVRKKIKSEKINSSKVMILKNIVKQITGYSIDQISLEDNFQEDLGIDSIKKANIIFKYINETQEETNTHINLSEIRNLKEVYDFSNKNQVIEEKKSLNTQWSFFRESWIKRGPTPKILKAKTYQVIHVLDVFNLKMPLDTLDALWVLNCDQKDNKNIFEPKVLEDFIKFLKNIQNIDLMIFSSEGRESYLMRGICSLCKTLKKEKIFNRLKLIIADRDFDQSFISYMNLPVYEEIKIIGSETYVKSLESAPRVGIQKRLNSILIIGGAKGIGYEIANGLENSANIDLIIVGRTKEEELKGLRSLKKKFKTLKYINADITKKGADEEISRELDSPPCLIINSSGSGKSVRFNNLELNEAVDVLESKPLSFINVDRLLKRYNSAFAIHFSSIISLIGFEGELLYSSANALIEGYSSSNDRHSYFSWPGWDQVGMTKGLFSYTLKNEGLELLPVKEGIEKFNEYLKHYFGENIILMLENEASSFQIPLSLSRELESVLGRSINKSSFIKEMSTCYLPELNGHKPDSDIYFPASFALNHFLAFLFLNKGVYKGKLNNFEVKMPLIIDEVSKDIVSTFIQSENKLHFKLNSMISHFLCSYELNSKADQELYFNTKKGFRITKDHIYSCFGQFHRDDFQYLEEIHILDKICTSELCLDQIPKIKSYSAPFDKIPFLLDSLLQMIGILGNIYGDHPRNIPIKIEEIFFDLSILVPYETYRSRCELLKVDEKGIYGEGIICDSNSRVLFSLKGIYNEFFDVR